MAAAATITLISSADLGELKKEDFPITISVQAEHMTYSLGDILHVYLNTSEYDAWVDVYNSEGTEAPPSLAKKTFSYNSDTLNYELEISYEDLVPIEKGQNTILVFFGDGAEFASVEVSFIFVKESEVGLFIGDLNGTSRKVKEMFIGVPLKLPNEYQQVKYLESTGTQWIDTGVPAFSKTRSEIDIEFTHITDKDNYFFNGYMRETIEASFSHAIGSSYYTSTGIRTFDWNTIYGSLWRECDFQRHIFFLDGKTGEYGTLDGIFTGSGAVEEVEYQEGEDLYLFAAKAYSILDDAMGVTYKAYEKVYGAKYYLDGVLVRDFIPCIRKSDNKPGMYDLVNNQFYINQGTEEFLIGEKITSARKVKEAFIGVNGIAKKVFEVLSPMISFMTESVSYSTVTTYDAERGMTWAEWINSDYNIDNTFANNGTCIGIVGGAQIIYLQDGVTEVNPTDLIIDNYTYLIGIGDTSSYE